VKTSHRLHTELEILAAISGVMIALQSRANGELSQRLGNSVEAALISFSSGLLVIALITPFILAIRVGAGKLREAVRERRIAKWRLGAGMLGGSFVALQTHVVPIIGVALYSVASIAGQTVVSLIVDRIGLTGGGKKEITPRRVITAFVTVAAVLVSVFDKLSVSNFSFLAVLLATLAGAFVGVQRALNGQINEFSGQSFTTSFLNFIMGTSFLIIFLLLLIVFKGDHLVALPTSPWWMYTGGVIGVIYIAFTSTIVQHLGVLTFTLFSTGGTLIGSLLIDIFSPTQGAHVTGYLITGIAMTYIGVAIGGQSRLFAKLQR
jgi:bacterial/archaeal transporter family-2 protein